MKKLLFIIIAISMKTVALAQDLDPEKSIYKFNLSTVATKEDSFTPYFGFSFCLSQSMGETQKWDFAGFHDIALDLGLGKAGRYYYLAIWEELGANAIYDINDDNQIAFGLSPSYLHLSTVFLHWGYGVNFKYRYKNGLFEYFSSSGYKVESRFQRFSLSSFATDEVLLSFKYGNMGKNKTISINEYGFCIVKYF